MKFDGGKLPERLQILLLPCLENNEDLHQNNGQISLVACTFHVSEVFYNFLHNHFIVIDNEVLFFQCTFSCIFDRITNNYDYNYDK